MGLFFSLVMYNLTKIKIKPLLTGFLVFLSVQTCFQSFKDILSLIILSGTDIRTDAHNMSFEITSGLVPPVFFALLWGTLSLIFFVIALKKAYKPYKN